MSAYCRLYYRVPFSETDAMGIVHHSNHARYLERGRVELLRMVGLGYSQVIERGYHFPLTDIGVSFKKPLVFDEVLIIETALTEVSKIRLNFKYRIHKHDGPEILASELSCLPLPGRPAVTGETYHCAVNLQGRPVPMEATLFEKLSSLRGSL